MMPTPSTLPTINHAHCTKDHFPVNSINYKDMSYYLPQRAALLRPPLLAGCP